MFSFFSLFIFLWFVAAAKKTLFWIYLWQLKEYHTGRLIDHFRTHKGKKIFINYIFFLKIFLLFFILFNNYFTAPVFYILIIVYGAESVNFIFGIFKNKIRKPVFTPKATLLTLFFVSFVFYVYYGIVANFKTEYIILFLLVFDIMAPFLVSAVVLFFQPFFVAIRNNTLKKAAQKISKMKNLTVIAVTGSYGKTSVKEFLTTILSTKFNVLSTRDHKNSEIGIAQTILGDLNENHRIFVVEMGSYNKGGIKLLCNIVKPSMGIVTGVNEQHLATFGSMENLLSAEGGGELLKNLPASGTLIVNGDNKYCFDLYKKTNIKKRVYAVKKNKIDCDIWAEESEVQKNGLSFVAITKEKELAHFDVNVLGGHNIQNLLGSVIAAKELGMSLHEISNAAKNIRYEQAGIVLKKGVHDIDVIDSSYSSNPDGVIADMDYLDVFSCKKVIVMPCLIELGSKSDKIHAKIGEKISRVCDMAIITTKDKFKEIKKGAVDGGMRPDKIIFAENPNEIFNLITTFCKEGDAVLLEGRVPLILKRLLTKK